MVKPRAGYGADGPRIMIVVNLGLEPRRQCQIRCAFYLDYCLRSIISHLSEVGSVHQRLQPVCHPPHVHVRLVVRALRVQTQHLQQGVGLFVGDQPTDPGELGMKEKLVTDIDYDRCTF